MIMEECQCCFSALKFIPRLLYPDVIMHTCSYLYLPGICVIWYTL